MPTLFAVSILGCSSSVREIALSELGTISAQEIGCSWGSGALRCVHHTSLKKAEPRLRLFDTAS
jgi:hypothetical protein